MLLSWSHFSGTCIKRYNLPVWLILDACSVNGREREVLFALLCFPWLAFPSCVVRCARGEDRLTSALVLFCPLSSAPSGRPKFSPLPLLSCLERTSEQYTAAIRHATSSRTVHLHHTSTGSMEYRVPWDLRVRILSYCILCRSENCVWQVLLAVGYDLRLGLSDHPPGLRLRNRELGRVERVEDWW